MSDADCTPGREPRSVAASSSYSLLCSSHSEGCANGWQGTAVDTTYRQCQHPVGEVTGVCRYRLMAPRLSDLVCISCDLLYAIMYVIAQNGLSANNSGKP